MKYGCSRVASGSRMCAVIAVSVLVTLAAGVLAKTKVQTVHDETFEFEGLRTWDWHPSGAGEVKVLTSKWDDPERIRTRNEPTILAAVEEGLANRGLERTPGQVPDYYVRYYVLTTIGSATTQMGQFLPAVTEWGVPAFSLSTTSLRVYPTGTLVLDLTARERESVVWRGIAETEVKPGWDASKRAKIIRDAVKDMLEKFPPKKR